MYPYRPSPPPMWTGVTLGVLGGFLGSAFLGGVVVAIIHGSTGSPAQGTTNGEWAVYWIIFVGGWIASIVLGVKLSRRRVERAKAAIAAWSAPPQYQTAYSPDGRFYWDGYAWRPVPMTATAFSPDGRYWWDGRAWQPVASLPTTATTGPIVGDVASPATGLTPTSSDPAPLPYDW